MEQVGRHRIPIDNKFFNYYVQIESLGVGKFSRVSKIRSKRKKENPTALKKYILSDKKHFQTELENFLKIGRHKHVVKFLSAFKVTTCGEKNGYYLQLELCVKGSLKGIFRDREGSKYTERDVQQIALQLTSALSYMKEQGVLHRDIKPGNILVRSYSDINVAIADMNLSKFVDPVGPDTVLSTRVGTNFYVAPEVLVNTVRRNGRYNFKCDVWSLGIVIYELLSGGYKPFTISTASLLAIKEKFINLKQQQREEQKLRFKTGFKHGLEFEPPEAWVNVSNNARELLTKMLVVTPYRSRPSYQDILRSNWLNTEIQDSDLCPLFANTV